MIMGNYLSVAPVALSVMAAERSTVGIAHLTVVPENFKPSESGPVPENRPDRDD